MKSVVVFKWATDPRDIHVFSDGRVDQSDASFWVGDDDYLAVKAACDAAGEDGEVCGLTMAGGDISFAAARGASMTYTIQGLSVAADSLVRAKVLAAAIKKIGEVDVVTIGDADWDPAVPVLLGGLLEWETLMGAEEAVQDQDGLIVTRRYGIGSQKTLVTGPVVLGVAAKKEEESKPGMRTVITARKKPVIKIGIEELGLDTSLDYTSVGTALPEGREPRLYDGADPEEAVAQLIRTLQSEGTI